MNKQNSLWGSVYTTVFQTKNNQLRQTRPQFLGISFNDSSPLKIITLSISNGSLDPACFHPVISQELTKGLCMLCIDWYMWCPFCSILQSIRSRLKPKFISLNRVSLRGANKRQVPETLLYRRRFFFLTLPAKAEVSRLFCTLRLFAHKIILQGTH